MRELWCGLLDFILPPVCLACDGIIAAGDSKRVVCRRCRSLLRTAPPPLCERCGAPRLRTGRMTEPGHCDECAGWPAELHIARSACLMHPPADRIVHQLKYRGWSVLAQYMAEPMALALSDSDIVKEITAVVPVPTTSSRLRERGYNQAALIAQAVALRLACRCEQFLERTTGKSTQTTLQPAARGANVAGAFRVRSAARSRLEGAHVLIVDDVLTTGATAIECTRTLVAEGVRRTSVLTFARALDTRRLLG